MEKTRIFRKTEIICGIAFDVEVSTNSETELSSIKITNTTDHPYNREIVDVPTGNVIYAIESAKSEVEDEVYESEAGLISVLVKGGFVEDGAFDSKLVNKIEDAQGGQDE